MFADTQTTSVIDAELQRGERLIWRGRPAAGRWLYPQDALLIPFSIMWGGFAIFWEAGVLSSSTARNSVIFPLWGVPFVVIGLYMMFGRFFARRWVRDRTVYGLTNRRVISIAASLRGTRRVSSVWLGSFPAVDKRVGRDGRGTVWIGTFPFGARSLASDPGWPGSGRATGNAIVLADIPDAGEVYALINRQLSDMTSPRAEH